MPHLRMWALLSSLASSLGCKTPLKYRHQGPKNTALDSLPAHLSTKLHFRVHQLLAWALGHFWSSQRDRG